AWNSAPRSEAGQHLAGLTGTTARHRFRPGEADRGKRDADAVGNGGRHAELYGAGAGSGPKGAEHQGRCLQSRRNLVRVADRPAAVSRGDTTGNHAPALGSRAGSTERDQSAGKSRSRDDLLEVLAKGAG